MRGVVRLVQFFTRSAVMLLVMAVVMPVALVLGLPKPVTLALAIGLPGLTGLFWVSRRRRDAVAAALRAASAASAAISLVAPGPPEERPSVAPDPEAVFADPEAAMPRWRRPSLQRARRLDPSRTAAVRREPVRFPAGHGIDRGELRMVRYAVVPLLDWPDEVLGERREDLATGDEVRVLGSRGAFLEVSRPDGLRGWLHRTTVGPPAEPHPEAQDAMDAALFARGMR